jgi:hypothetical protein
MSLWSVIKGRFGSGASDVDQVSIDGSTNALNTVSYAHHEIHAGATYYLCQSVASMAASGPLTFAFTTPNDDSRCHLLVSATTAEDGRLQVVEGGGPTGGSPATPLNHRRETATASGVVTPLSGVTLSGGTTIRDRYWGKAGTVQAGGTAGESRADFELILKPNTMYQFSLSGTSASPGTLDLNWYEHTDKH